MDWEILFFHPLLDIDLFDFCINEDKLLEYIRNNPKPICIFPTSLLGFSPNLSFLEAIKLNYGVEIMMDNCESTLTDFNNQNISSYFTSTTSTYFGHLIQSIEGGFVLTNNKEVYEYCLMGRNHGMVRSLKENKSKYSNHLVDPSFDFNFCGSNFRNTEINAFFGRIDLKRAEKYINARIVLYECAQSHLGHEFLLPQLGEGDCPFALPIIPMDVEKKGLMLKECGKRNIEVRPIISGNLLRHKAFDKFGDFRDFPNSEFLHKNGFYVGLSHHIKREQIIDLCKELRYIAEI
jgi:dTDP-4-amino-4,6-dideoxygalactose transaminase